MAKKTVHVRALVERANRFFANSPDSARVDRLAVAEFLSGILHETGNYAGFNYLRDYSDPENDSTRVAYHVHHNLA